MHESDIQSVIELIYEELEKQWDYQPGTDHMIYIYGAYDGYDRNLVVRTVRYVIKGEEGHDGFVFSDVATFYTWHSQAKLAIISHYLVKYADAISLNEKMVERAHHLMKLVKPNHIPESLREMMAEA